MPHFSPVVVLHEIRQRTSVADLRQPTAAYRQYGRSRLRWHSKKTWLPQWVRIRTHGTDGDSTAPTGIVVTMVAKEWEVCN
jgi:hypothetical protein